MIRYAFSPCCRMRSRAFFSIRDICTWESPSRFSLRTSRWGYVRLRAAARDIDAALTLRREAGAPLLLRRVRLLSVRRLLSLLRGVRRGGRLSLRIRRRRLRRAVPLRRVLRSPIGLPPLRSSRGGPGIRLSADRGAAHAAESRAFLQFPAADGA